MIKELGGAFYHYDCKALNKKNLELRKEPDESIMQFWDFFCNLAFQIPEDEVDWKFLKEYFQYLLHISQNPHELESFEPLLAYLGVRDAKSKMYKVVVMGDPPSSPHETSLAP